MGTIIDDKFVDVGTYPNWSGGKSCKKNIDSFAIWSKLSYSYDDSVTVKRLLDKYRT